MLANVQSSDNPVLAMKAHMEQLESSMGTQDMSTPAAEEGAFSASASDEWSRLTQELRQSAGGNEMSDLFRMLSGGAAHASQDTAGSMQEGMNSAGFPMRPGAEVCHFFMKTGTCRFGATCKKDHPERPGAVSADPPGVKPLLNSAGLPMRPGKAQCAFYVKTGICKFGDKCVHDHPETGGGAPVPSASTAPDASEWSSLAQELRASTGGQTSVTAQSGVDAMMARILGAQGSAHGGGSTRSGMNSAGFPMRPGAEVCYFYMKTGTCRFGTNCKKDHPEKEGAFQADQPGTHVELNSKGLPLRPGRPTCPFFMKTGTCKFSTKCVHDHPEDGTSSPFASAVPSAAPGGGGASSQWNSLAAELRAASGFGQAEGTTFLQEEDMEAQLIALMQQSGQGFLAQEAGFNASVGLGGPGPGEETQLNTRGLPIRPGKPQCKFYMQTGKCRFGAQCVNNHPEVDALIEAFTEAGIAPDPAADSGAEGSAVAAALAAVGSDFGW
eukprot:TRINITY_DN29852_c0_g1_i1.p1 TRINITY_DN29852_c0_g1~~TRINITY_DN29852_c0_g1_i1.p1  ORF type:complete len:559 (-),score=97.92 TRINITY_DN29852_c0_g1_i1:76-1566(-)